MFPSLLIANRGEIACRVIATARRMGIRTVAVFSDADASARHVALADEAIRIGPAPAAESYLRAEAILEAAQKTGAQAIHPGYGFLSENPAFAEAVAKAGLIFVGPPASAIRAMGLKDAAKRLMEKAGVPVVPGYHGDAQETVILAGKASEIGYPVLIKASAGGGGKGMRLVEKPEDFREALAAAKREARAAFGNDHVLVEKYISRPRHIEMQVFADSHGNVIHLFERDCSLQRRHQKVIEEAPAPGMTEEVRAAMGAAAVEAARAIGYRGAGTVEFIADGSGPLRPDGFWFMEMNTRLQVEHPVTEAITGVDLVELQLRVAAGQALPFAQDDLRIDGHAFEARLYAEDAARGFLPATGTLHRLGFPPASEFGRGPVRVDSGVREGDAISPHYDPLIAKIIAHGPDRAVALARLAAALGQCRIAGTVTNLAFLEALARHPGFAEGEVDTGLIARDVDSLVVSLPPSETAIATASLAALDLLSQPRGDDPWTALRGFRNWFEADYFATLEQDGRRIERQVFMAGSRQFRIEGGASPVHIAVVSSDGRRLRYESGDRVRDCEIARYGNSVTVFEEGAAHTFEFPDLLGENAAEDAAGDQVIAPMPGTVKLVVATVGKPVSRGDPLFVLEAMKMEHTLTAPRAGSIAEILVAAGEQVSEGTVLASLAPETADA
jgi:3-methylcrotonyl-CoA carboxylase alpha subunit